MSNVVQKHINLFKKYCAPTFYPWQFFYSSDFKDIYQLSTEVKVASGGNYWPA